MTENPRIREALLYTEVNNSLRCGTCERYCLIERYLLGYCGTRKNIGGRLYTLVYGDISQVEAHPIEHKPFFHFYPGSLVLTVSTWSCNFVCGWCFRKYLSRAANKVGTGRFVSPVDMISLVYRCGCEGIAISFNEPTLLFEWSLEVFTLAREQGLYSTYVSNGYITASALESLANHGLEAINIDIKGDAQTVRTHCGGDVERIWKRAVQAKHLGLWVEMTTLIIPGITDDEDCLRPIARRIRQDLGRDTPWHVNAYFPRDEIAFAQYGMATSVDRLMRAREIGLEEGLNYVYAGGYDAPYQNTYCPSCGELLIERYGFGFDRFDYKMGAEAKCYKCGCSIPIVGNTGPCHGRL